MAQTDPQTIDVSEPNERRIQQLLTEAARTWGDRLLGAVAPGSPVAPLAEHYSSAFSEVYKQAVTPVEAIDDIERKTTFVAFAEMEIDQLYYLATERGVFTTRRSA